MNVINASIHNIEEILNIYHLAIKHMNDEKNYNQWTLDDNDFIKSIKPYIEKKEFYIIKDNDEIVGFFAMIHGIDKTYNDIKGSWLNNDEYITIHKIAVKYYQKGIFSKILNYVESHAKNHNIFNIRIDTHKNNISMNTSLKNKGFSFCGIITLNGDFSDENALRNAYIKCL